MFQRHLHRHGDVDLVMSAFGDSPQGLPVLIAFGTALRRDLASALREVVATAAWTDDFHARRGPAPWRGNPRFDTFLDHGLERRRDRGPKYEHLNAALLTFPETRAALYRVRAANCPQHCRTEHRTYAEERHVDDYREALFGWYAAIQHTHACVVQAAKWFQEADAHGPQRPDTFTDWLTHTGRGPAHRTSTTPQAVQETLRELLLMMHAWSPHTFEAIDVAFQKAEGERAFHAWGAGFEPAGRQEAAAAAEALARVLTPEEREEVRTLVAAIESGDEWSRDVDLAVDSVLPCTSDRHRTYITHSDDGREACAQARARVYEEARQPWSADVDRDASAAALARLLLGARADRIEAALDKARSQVARTLVETAPQLWHDNAESLRTTREGSSLDVHEAASLLGIKPATLERFEHGTGKLPGRPVALRYLQLVALTCAQTHTPVPDCIPEAISQPAISLPTTV
ncbi:helix-turn-helix transcriptional regulator [Streptomyces ardesiacus]|uniref:helix-turn-helix transcriptional regulator n=1 Tax=Streptomyces TaxID=1883 RepID=UPI0006ADB708|nr:helix-turn-helix transcriptional regulator [Streptomyces sp. NRRL F-4707]